MPALVNLAAPPQANPTLRCNNYYIEMSDLAEAGFTRQGAVR
jgi:hypothetical protein